MILNLKHILFTITLILGISVFVANAGNYSTINNFVETLSQIEVSMYPNPAINILNVDFENIPNESFEVTVFSYLGNVVYKETIENENSNYKLTLNVQNFRQGIYILQIKTKDSVSTHQFKKL